VEDQSHIKLKSSCIAVSKRGLCSPTLPNSPENHMRRKCGMIGKQTPSRRGIASAGPISTRPGEVQLMPRKGTEHIMNVRRSVSPGIGLLEINFCNTIIVRELPQSCTPTWMYQHQCWVHMQRPHICLVRNLKPNSLAFAVQLRC
jgi:hypothetical protein